MLRMQLWQCELCYSSWESFLGDLLPSAEATADTTAAAASTDGALAAATAADSAVVSWSIKLASKAATATSSVKSFAA